jgi:hypothetical protein
MEEQQIQEFVHQVVTDEAVRRELCTNAAGVIAPLDFTPRVVEIISHLIPRFAFENAPQSNEKWWHA